ncbi:MAG: LamG-like jellyroll fold domain-containing protein [Chitinophagales bacterium]
MKKAFLLITAMLIVVFACAQIPIAYYPFISDASDASGNGYNGTLFGNATANDTLLIGDDATDYVKLPETFLTGLNDFTITFIVKFNSIHTTGQSPANTILHAWGISDEDELKISHNQGSSVFQVSVKTNQVTFPFIAATGQWYCFAVVRASNEISVYIDGQQVGTTQTAGTGSLAPATNGFVLGQEEDCGGGCFVQNQSLAGKLDELKFYNYAFTADEAVSTCVTCGDKLFYPFTIDAADSSGNALDGTLGGSATVSNGNVTIGDNATDFVSVPSAALNGLENFDVSFAVEFDTLHDAGDFPANTILHAWGINEDELKISHNKSTNSFQISINGSEYFTNFFPLTHTWYCFHVQRKNDTLSVYENAALIHTEVVSSAALQVSSGGVVLGQEEDCVGGCFAQNQSLAGKLGFVKINNCPQPVPKNERCDFTIGISEPNENSFSIFPNPADENISVLCGSFHNVTIRMLNDLGQQVRVASQNNSASVILPTEKLSEGIYLVEVWNENQIVFTQKLLVAH